MGVDGGDDDAEDSDAESDEEDDDNWDDDQMLKVDEQLAEIFKQQAAATSGSKKSEQKRKLVILLDLTFRTTHRVAALQEPCSRHVRHFRASSTPESSSDSHHLSPSATGFFHRYLRVSADGQG